MSNAWVVWIHTIWKVHMVVQTLTHKHRWQKVEVVLYLHDVQSLLITADKDTGRGWQGQRGGQGNSFLGEAAGSRCTVCIAGVLHLRHVVIVDLEHHFSILILWDHFKGVWENKRPQWESCQRIQCHCPVCLHMYNYTKKNLLWVIFYFPWI